MTIYVILFFVALLTGMALSVYAFGTGGKRQHIFQDIYFSVEDTNGIGVIYTKTGEYSAVLKLDNPVQKYSANIDSYYESPICLPPSHRHWVKDMPCTNRTFSHGTASNLRMRRRKNFCRNPISDISREGNIRIVARISLSRRKPGRVACSRFDNKKWKDVPCRNP